MLLPQIPASGQQLYDDLMAAIEPELTTAQRPSNKQEQATQTVLKQAELLRADWAA